MSKPVFAEAVAADAMKIKEAAFFINPLLGIEGITYTPQFGLSVMNTEPEAVEKLLNRMIETGNTTALEVAVTGITLGADYIQEDVDDPDLDKLLGDKAAATPLLTTKKKQYEPAMFWIGFEVTSPYIKENGQPAVIRTSSVSITKKAPKAFLSKLLKIVNHGGDIEVEVLSVKDANPVREYELLDLDF
jgi:hypothetical protein